MTAYLSPQRVYAFPGGGSYNGCRVTGGVPLGADWEISDDIYLIWSQSRDGSGHPTGSLSELQTQIAGNGLFSFVLTGLSTAQKYFAYLSRDPIGSGPDWVGDPIAFRTLHDPTAVGGEFRTKWAYGSCQYWYNAQDIYLDAEGKPLQKAWIDMREFDPDVLFETGDVHYRGGHPENFGTTHISDWVTWADMSWQQIWKLPEMRKARSLVLQYQLSDDHEFSGNNGDSRYPVGAPMLGTGYRRSIEMQAVQKVFPKYDLAVGSTAPPRGLYGSFMLSPNVRVVLLDAESLDRDYSYLDDAVTDKSFLGAAQDAWLRALLLEPVVLLNVIVCSKAYLGTAIPVGDIETNDKDKVWNYGQWRDDFASFITTNEINVVWLGGDRHMVAYDSGRTDPTHNPWGGFPCYIGSGWNQERNLLTGGEVYEWNYPWVAGPGDPPDQEIVMQYIRGEIIDDVDEGTVTMTGDLRYLKPDEDPEVPPHQWEMVTYNTAQIIDTWGP